ncbi:MAG: hypothetical protein FWH23_07775 [Bacteroidales bacterium]|nr:hypothetical protein [Bacteroidales bacterium]MCL2133090.1 hypothetical protein [Bacteroidales bacterium]
MKRIIIFICFALTVSALQAQQNTNEEMRRHIRRAETALRTSNLDDALAEYKMAQALAPQYPGLYKAIGGVYEQMGGTADLDEAIAYYKRYLELAPNAEDSRAIQDKIYDLEYLHGKSEVHDKFLDDLSGTWVAMDNLTIENQGTGNISYHADFVFKIVEIQKTGKYRVTIRKEGSRYYSESIIDKTVNIVPQKDASFNFTLADVQTYKPKQSNYSWARFGAGLLGNLTDSPLLTDAANIAIDAAQESDLPNSTQTAYVFALKYRNGKLEGLVNVIQKFANPDQQRTLEEGVYEINFVKQEEAVNIVKRKIEDDKKNIENEPDIISNYAYDKWGNKLSNKEIKNKLANVNPQLLQSYKNAKTQEAVWGGIGWTGYAASMTGMLLLALHTPDRDGKRTVEGINEPLAWWLFGGGIGGLVLGATISTSGISKKHKIIDEYNNQVRSEVKSKYTSELRFGLTSSGGIGLVLTF